MFKKKDSVMLFLAKSLILLLIIAGMPACASLKSSQNDPMAQFPYRHNAYDLIVAWNSLQTEHGTIIDGLIKNVRYPEVRDIDLTVKVFDPKGSLLSKGSFLLVPAPLSMYESAPFIVKLPDAPLAKGNVIEFIMRYHGNDGYRNNFDWLTSFKADAATGVPYSEYSDIHNKW